MTGVITLTLAGVGTGPFYIYSDVDGYTVPFLSAISKAALLAGLPVDNIPDGSTIIRVKSLNSECNNYVDIEVYPTTTTTTTVGCIGYHYTFEGYECDTCGIVGYTGSVLNDVPLTVGKYYYRPAPFDYKVLIVSESVCLGVIVDHILDSDKKDTCAEVICPTTTTTTTLP